MKRTNAINLKSISFGGTTTYDTTSTVDRKFVFSNFKVFKDFSFDYNHVMNSNLSMQFSDNSFESKAQALFDFINVPGQVNSFQESFIFDYSPKFMSLDKWLSPKFTYKPTYKWKRNALSQDQVSTATLSSNGNFNTTFSLSLSNLIERFYTPENSNTSRRTSRYSSRSSQSSSNSSNDKPFEIKNVYIKSF